ncbi:hypothetical protein QNI19_36005 [Cytophagaceae bacterium DM2B3-1]|uniref:Uncharacterized protein n=1 Tax=Xanthocytophaga flava TaxID=3048013 RepID=A0ABT7CZK1_9BACT|nr:hypothetical protein [Xanthocytophaga flavus]MDJ1498395.1 hypothetical protein [Xanthocytophaga flavus]
MRETGRTHGCAPTLVRKNTYVVGWQQSGDLPCVNRSQVTQKKYPKYGQNCNGRQNDRATVRRGK